MQIASSSSLFIRQLYILQDLLCDFLLLAGQPVAMFIASLRGEVEGVRPMPTQHQKGAGVKGSQNPNPNRRFRVEAMGAVGGPRWTPDECATTASEMIVDSFTICSLGRKRLQFLYHASHNLPAREVVGREVVPPRMSLNHQLGVRSP